MRKLSMRQLWSMCARLALRRPGAVMVAAGLGVCLSVWLSATRLEFHTSRLDLVSSENRYKQLHQAHSREFETVAQGVIVVIRGRDPERAKAFATALGQRWEVDPTIEKVLYRLSLETLRDKGLFYLSLDALAQLQARLRQAHDMLVTFADQPTLPHLFALINREITEALVDYVFTGFLTDEDEPPIAADLGFLRDLLRQLNAQLEAPGALPSPWETWLAADAQGMSHDGFLWSDDRQLLFVLATPRADAGDFDQFRLAAQRIRQDIQELRRAYPDLEVGLTGEDMLEFDEMAAAQRDMGLATVISLVGVACLFIAFFRGVVRPGLAIATLVIGIAWSLGFTTLAVGHLNIFTIAFGPMLVGLGIDYGIHLLTRYEAERRAGRSLQAALEATLSGTGAGLASAALTTAAAFYSLAYADFLGLRELGVITGSGLLLILVATLTVLPALLVLDERRRRMPTAAAAAAQGERAGYLAPLYRYPRATLAVSALLAGLSLLELGHVDTDFNLLRLQSQDSEAVVWAQRMFESSKRSVLVAELAAASLGEVQRKVAALQRFPVVERVDSPLAVLPEAQDRQLALLAELRPLIADVELRPTAASFDLDAFRGILQRLAAKLGEDAEMAQPSADGLAAQAREVRQLIEELLRRLEQLGSAAATQALSAFQRQLQDDVAAKLALLRRQLHATPVTLADLPPELRARYIGKTGRYRLFVFPSENVWDYPALSRFVEALQTVDAKAIGTPVANSEYIRTIQKGYEAAGFYALCGILLLAFLTFRSAQATLLALVPLGIGAIWTVGLMAWFDVRFNMANLLFIPLIIGMGIDNGIHVVHRFLAERANGVSVPLARSTGKAITLSSLTTIVGFGSLMVSGHHGIHSLGLLVTLGVGSVLAASLTTLPSLLTLLGSGGGAPVQAPRRRDRLPMMHDAIGQGRPSSSLSNP
jgi:hopanoid biosynthesis associated RND transporter like protein HpnN